MCWWTPTWTALPSASEPFSGDAAGCTAKHTETIHTLPRALILISSVKNWVPGNTVKWVMSIIPLFGQGMSHTAEPVCCILLSRRNSQKLLQDGVNKL